MDLALDWTEGNADIILKDGDLAVDKGLASAIAVSLFSDARRPADVEGITDLRGYWPDTPEDRHGSLLWLLQREKIIPETLNKAKAWVELALKWLTEDGIAEKVAVGVEREGVGQVAIAVHITRGHALRWQHLWDSMEDMLLKEGSVSVAVSYV